MGDDEPATLDSQFYEFAKLFETKDSKRTGLTISLYRSDYWFRQAKLLDDRRLTMTDTGILFFRLSKTELDFLEWEEFLVELCKVKRLDEELVRDVLTNCGLPGQGTVTVPQYRDYYNTYKPKEKMAF